VKNRLDYQLELAELTRKIQQKHMVNWIIQNVQRKTPDKQIFKKCLEDLEALATKA